VALHVEVDRNAVADFCRRWRATELSLFGSVLHDGFTPESDVDVLVRFADDAGWSLWDLVDMREELKALFGREVDLVEEGGLRNPFRRHRILASREILYAA